MTQSIRGARSALKTSTATLALSLAMVSAPAFAQATATADAPEAVDTIVVTGSLIRNPNLERSTPVTVTSADEIELMSSNTAEEILREIPGIVPSIGSAVNNGNGGASFVNLRGLGSNRNIVLLDGVRLTPAELNGRFDLNNIPLALVERVDVLTGGASTTYGADAIAGVVNFLTKRDFAGMELTSSYQITEKGDGPVFRTDLVLGANFDDGRGNVVLAVGYQKADPVYQGDRDFSRFQVDSFNGSLGGSGTSTPSRWSGVNPTGGNSITDVTVCGATGQPACVNPQAGQRQVTADGTAFRTGTAFDAFNFNPFNIFQTPFKRYNVYAAGRYEVNDAIEVYSRAIFSKNTVNTIIAPSGAFGISTVVPLSNPFLTAAQRNAFCNFDIDPGLGYTPRFNAATCAAAATAAGPTDPNYRSVTANVSRRATEFGPRISEFTTTYFDYRAGARGGITDTIDWDLWASYGESENNQVQSGYWLNSRVRNALLADKNGCFTATDGCVPVNLFGPDGSITPEMNAYLTGDSTVATKFAQTQVRGTIAGDFGLSLPSASNPLAFAIGGEYRKYTASQVSDLLSQSGDLGGAGGAAPNIAGGYSVYEAFGELILPLVQDRPFFEDLTIEGGLRYSSYSVDAPGDPSYETWTWKAGGNWTPGGGFKIRGNYAKAVRAPNIAELFSPQNTLLTNLADDPCANYDDEGAPIPGRPTPSGTLRSICLAQGAPASSIGFIPVPTAGQANYTGGGNPALGPETSDSWTLGAVWTPRFAPGLALTVDYYNIKVNGAVSSPTPGDAITACFGPNPLSPAAGAENSEDCRVIGRNPVTGALAGDSSDTPGLYLPLSNLGRLATDGIDVTLNYAHDFDNVRWALSVIGNWTNSSTFQATPSSDNRECVGFYGVNCASIQPEYSFSVRNTFTISDVDLSVLWRHISKVKYEDYNIPDAEAFAGTLNGEETDFNFIPAYNYIDVSARFTIAEPLVLTFGVQNLFDVQPKVVGGTLGSTAYNSGNIYPSTYDSLGRRYTVSARLRF